MFRRLANPLSLLIVAFSLLPAGLAPAADAERPNILFCIADDASYPHMGAYGCQWVKTPGFDRVAREGLLFTRSYTPNAKCAPSRSCIITGRNSWQLKEAANHWCFFPPGFKSYVEALGEHGYFVGTTGKGWGPGIAKDAEGKPRQLVGTGFNARKIRPPAKAISGNDYAANFRDFLDAAPEAKPWCFWYGGHEPHRAYEYGAGISKGDKQLSDIDVVPGFWPDNDVIRTDMLDYAFEIEWFDRHLARMLDDLQARGELENTLVVVTADNGMPFPRVKGQEYELSNHLPLAIMWPRGIEQPGRKVDDFVSFIDFAPTFVELAGLEWEEAGMAPSPGKSLTGIFNADSTPHRDHVLVGKERHDVGRPHDQGYPIRGIVKGDLLYLKNFEPDRWPAGNPETGYLNTDGSPTKTEILATRTDPSRRYYWEWCFGKRPAEELYNVAEDPECLHNLAELPGFATKKKELADQLTEELRRQDDPRMFGNGAVFDQYPYADDATKNFYDRFSRGEKLRAGWVNPGDFEEAPLD
jgi:arylsulfatase A-like enzyme